MSRRVASLAPCALCLLGVLMLAGPAWAQDPDEEGLTFDFDDPPETRNRITDELSWGAAIELEGTYQDNFDLDRDVDDDEFSLEPKLDLALTFQPDETLRIFVNLELTRVFFLDSPTGSHSDDTVLELKEAYITLHNLIEGLTLQLGRQQYQDELEWWVDQELDAARVYVRPIPRIALEASVSQQDLADRDLFNKDEKLDKVINWLLVGHAAIGEESLASAYLLLRDGREDESEELYFVGLQSIGELSDEMDYWINAAAVFGEARDEDGTRDIAGYAIDLVGIYKPELPLEPSLTLGFAYGSGDDDPGSGTDGNFRQTGLQENNAVFNGVARFKYYGETFDPELSNMAIFTAGAGLRPSEASSVDLVYHYYRQAEAADFLGDSNLEAEPSGRSADLGHGLDLVVGYHEIEDLSAELVLGAFFPGDAFGPDADNAYFIGFEVQYEF